MTISSPAAPCAPPNIASMAWMCFVAQFGDDHAFALRQPVGFDHNGITQRVRKSPCVLCAAGNACIAGLEHLLPRINLWQNPLTIRAARLQPMAQAL